MTSMLNAALALVRRGIPVFHVEPEGKKEQEAKAYAAERNHQ